MSLNKVMLIGNVGHTPEVRHLDSGVTTASFSLATSERFKNKAGEVQNQTEWHNIVCWRNTAEVVEKYVTKGTQLYVEGKLKTRKYTSRDGLEKYITEIIADNIQFVGKKQDNQESQSGPSYAQPGKGVDIGREAVSGGGKEDGDDDLPF